MERPSQLRLTEKTACRGDVGDRSIGVSAKEPLRFGHPDRPQFFGKRPGRVAEQPEQGPPGQVTAAGYRVTVEMGITKGAAQVMHHAFAIEFRRPGLAARRDRHRRADQAEGVSRHADGS